MVPQFLPAAWQLVGTHPHWLGCRTPQMSDTGQPPQSIIPPQSSAIVPHTAPLAKQVVG
jgi:hypothetical protein